MNHAHTPITSVETAPGPANSAALPAHDPHPDASRPPAIPRLRWWQIGLALIAISCSGGGLFYLGWQPRVLQNAVLAHESEHARTALPRVQVAKPGFSPLEMETLLPGDVQAVEETTIYPRTSGYLKQRLVDIGDTVEEGQLLAEIDTPEVDQQLRQAEASLEQLKARKKTAQTAHQLALATLRRVESVPQGIITMQEIDERRAQVDTAASAITAAEADIAAGEAAVQRMKELQSFKRVYAPFSGTITARSVELGQLVTSGNDTAQSLFRLSRTNPVRVFVDVPQMYAPSVKPGLEARLVVRELPGRAFIGSVTRTAGAIDATTRTLLTEVQVPNDDAALLTGSYVQVRFKVKRAEPSLLIPATALIFNAEGTKVAVVDAQQHIQLRDVVVEGDLGTQLRIGSGLVAEDQVVINPGDRMSEGLHVKVDVPSPEKKD